MLNIIVPLYEMTSFFQTSFGHYDLNRYTKKPLNSDLLINAILGFDGKVFPVINELSN